MIRIIPTRAIIGVKNDGLRKFRKTSDELPPFSELRPVIQGVTVVPMLEPISIPIVCGRVIIPEPTRPTSITVVAEDD
jgi:hypothetical protein